MIDRSRVLELVPERKLEAAVGLMQTLTEAQRMSLKTVAMNMWPAYMSAARQCMPQAIQLIKANAHGFKNFTNYWARILFHCGKLHLAAMG